MASSSQSSQTIATAGDSIAKPWKDVGYRGFSAFLASDNDFLIFRKFGTLSARLLLYLQDEIAVLEEALRDIEDKHSGPTAPDLHNGSFRQDQLTERKALLDTLSVKVRAYNELLLQHSTLRERPLVDKRYTQSISNWLYNEENAIAENEVKYIENRFDLVQLVPKPRTHLRRLLEKSTRFRLSRIWASRDPPLPLHSAHVENLHYSSDTRIDNFFGLTVIVLGMLMLIAPLWALAVTAGTMRRLGVITGFIVLFLGLIACTTTARPFETLAAAAAYSAVLVVFLQSA
ncbi:hypothetical protein BU25DRAFT_407849 [Macroventuria anomochaeta]|uniref:Uncharacterized protein n=1 Tax=Macroventuria anomochaeta TaxID=301207 RepID=A0ACB6SAL3_9PLEO|nr:uncharacterized protein BU25DRAFT_407849 [Macroventuria anomochaeta]KAF2631335.1 hypothetical protein BU25DRAFT_407849 [Macroventuria anomochaeta]